MSESGLVAQILFLGHQQFIGGTSWQITKSFKEFQPFANHICTTLSSTDKYLLIMSSDHLENLLHDPIYEFPQVQIIFVYYNGNKSLTTNGNRFNKIIFCHQCELLRELDKLFINYAIGWLRPINRQAITEFASSVNERVSAKRPSNLSQPVSQSSPTINYTNVELCQIELHIDNRMIASIDGRLVWKLDSFREKMSRY